METEVVEPEEFFQVGQQENRLVIYLRYPLFKALDEFATKEGHREQVGLLVGRFGMREGKVPFILIEDAVESTAAGETTNYLEEGLWKRASRIAIARHPNREVLGWFHGHAGEEMAISTDEATVHKRFFPEDYQVLYRIGKKNKDRIFYIKNSNKLEVAGGFCIYGKPPADSGAKVETVAKAVSAIKASGPAAAASLSPEQMLTYLERSMEKIQRRLQNPPVTAKDVLIVALLLLNMGLVWQRSAISTSMPTDTASIERGQAEISAQVAEVRERISKLEQHLADLQLLDQQLKIAAGEEPIEGVDDRSPAEVATQSPKPQATGLDHAPKAPDNASLNDGKLAGGEGKIRLYTVVKNDTLSTIVAKSYPGAGSEITKAFARYNQLKGPDFNIFEGDVLKIPDEKALH